MLSVSPGFDMGFTAIKNTVKSLLQYTERKRERVEFILDPLQAIYTLALFSFYPVGTKISIHNNILSIQPPNYGQGAIRWLQSDSKEDIYHLFHACKRFTTYYGFLKKCKTTYKQSMNVNSDCRNGKGKNTGNNKKNDKNNNNRVSPMNLYDILVEYAKKGLTKLGETYSDVDKISLLHTIHLYKNILTKPHTEDNNHELNIRMNDDSIVDNEEPIQMLDPVIDSEYPDTSKNTHIHNIDDVFVNIKHIYNKEHFNIMANVISLIIYNEHKTDIIFPTIDGYNTMMKPLYVELRKWIHNNLVF